jgi:hypothetical protein
MTLAEAELIFAGWEEAPPAHHLLQVLARQWGWQPPASARRGRHPAPDPNAVLAVPGMVAKPVGEGLPAVVLDFETLKRTYRR